MSSSRTTDPAIDVRACMPRKGPVMRARSHAEAEARGDKLITTLSALRQAAVSDAVAARRRFRWALYALGKRVPEYAK